MTEERKKHLTTQEWNAIAKLTSNTHLDNVFDVYCKRNGEDCFKDFETGRTTSISAGLKWLYDGLAYPLEHDGLDENEATIIVGLFKEFKSTKDDLSWLLAKEN